MAKKLDKGYLLPEVINPPKICICVEVPCDRNHALAFMGQIVALGYWWTWERDDAKRGTDAARVWRPIADNVNQQLIDCGAFDMTCGCVDNPDRLTRVTEDGVVEVSDDGGETWTPSPGDDPRVTSVEYPPLDGPDGESKQCAAADNIVANFTELVNEVHDLISASSALFTVIGFIASFVAIWLSAGSLFYFIAPFASAFFGLGASGIAAAFTEDVWTQLKCAIFCNIGTDGDVTEANLPNILADIDENITGAANPIIHAAFELMGINGLNNWGRTGSATADDCDCDNCGECDPAGNLNRLTASFVIGQTNHALTSGTQWDSGFSRWALYADTDWIQIDGGEAFGAEVTEFIAAGPVCCGADQNISVWISDEDGVLNSGTQIATMAGGARDTWTAPSVQASGRYLRFQRTNGAQWVWSGGGMSRVCTEE